MAKLTIEIEENEFALWDIIATLDGEVILEDGNFTSEWVALTEARYKAWLQVRKSDDVHRN